MNKTTNYHLNQWSRNDRVLMDDFNADNSAIEAALTSLEARVAIMDKVFPDLIYQLGQVSTAVVIDRERPLTRRLMDYDAFYDPDTYTLTGGITIANNQAILNGTGATGTITMTVHSDNPEPWKEIRLWFHHRGGTVIPKLNGNAMTPLYHHLDNTALGDGGTLWAYSWTGPSSQSQQLTFEVSCGESSRVLLFDFCIAYL